MVTTMKKAAMVACVMALTAFAEANDKVVIFDMQGAILSTDIAQQRLQSLESKADFISLKAKFESLKADLQALQKEAETKGLGWSESEKSEHRKKMEYLNADLQLAAKKIQAEQVAVAQAVMNELSGKARTALNEIITAEGAGLVLDAKAAIFANPSFNITAKVTEKINKAK